MFCGSPDFGCLVVSFGGLFHEWNRYGICVRNRWVVLRYGQRHTNVTPTAHQRRVRGQKGEYRGVPQYRGILLLQMRPRSDCLETYQIVRVLEADFVSFDGIQCLVAPKMVIIGRATSVTTIGQVFRDTPIYIYIYGHVRFDFLRIPLNK